MLLCLLPAFMTLPGNCDSGGKAELPPSVETFFDLNCYECHNDVDKKGELDLESLVFDPSNPSTMDLWAFIHDRVRDEEMPPKKESLVEPGERFDFLEGFEGLLHDVSRERIAVMGRVPSRRLNRIEYENTIHDLLGIKIPIRELLPEDPTTDGFSNIAEAQQVSYHLLQKYLEVIDISLEEAFQRAIQSPPSVPTESPDHLQPIEILPKLPTIFNFRGRKVFQTTDNRTYRYDNGHFVDTGSTLDLQGTIERNAAVSDIIATSVYKRKYDPSELGVGLERIPNERQGIYFNGQLLSFPTTHGYHGRMQATAVPETGWYRIRVKAQAHNPPEGRNVWARIYTGILRAKAPMTYWVGKFEATRELKEFTFDAWIRKDHIIGIQPVDKTLEWVPTKTIQDLSVLDMPAVAVAVECLEVERIYPGMGKPQLRERLFGKLSTEGGDLVSQQPGRDLQKLLRKFAARAFRRPVKAIDLQPYHDFARGELAATGSLLKAVRAGYRAILCSHRFLYFAEEPGRLDDYSVASRLSYFLWSTLPDEELLEQARLQQLTKPEVLSAQIERMLEDPRAEAFVRNFADSWLDLRDITFTTPDAKLYPEFDDILLHSMLDETHAFLEQMIRNNLSVTHIIDSDFALVNERLAKHYGFDCYEGTGLQQVFLMPGDRRGGIITQASVLKVTANGTATSPVVRGVWLLERILGKHIPPPPDQVSAIEPDIRGAVSIRDQLDMHRNTESCMTCHRKIDPPGFALENYDVIGGWRENYRAIDPEEKWTDGPVVDASYQFPDGTSFHDIEGFKNLALSDPDQIARNLLRQILTYATGAEIKFADRREIEEIVNSLAQDNYGFRSLIHATVQSSIFLSK